METLHDGGILEAEARGKCPKSWCLYKTEMNDEDYLEITDVQFLKTNRAMLLGFLRLERVSD
ncbi:predicted protein [Sclerotinia sclerotiorum 1980 UF-70]|uniref:Uncharacterized protein n=1 Tax=Sclerotinia sclerotiorum (strain ATCC 18683 / 1980 / Ss-1) TaxID=665079 RepID=A7EUY1_SCLS1|nr:predicted protein [Sclerotinia sclerotiorum 1980 UF-70]EDN93273.1 predicted protein [Sclerotinia sclerotiorum 1980 UF-70]